MTLPRVVTAETLDGLAESDPAAIRSRRDLQRVHRAMGTRGIVGRALRSMTMPLGAAAAPLRILELGAGDGTLMLGVARALRRDGQNVELTVRVADVFDWAADAAGDSSATGVAVRWDLIVATLFLHHFEGSRLATLLAAIEARSDRFFACAPRRARHALAASHLVGAIGANAVTREDAVLSVHAGFRDAELSALWPAGTAGWRLSESAAGLFSHCFCAQRGAAATPIDEVGRRGFAPAEPH